MPVLGCLSKAKQYLVLGQRVAPLLSNEALEQAEATVKLHRTLLLKIARKGQIFVDTEEILVRQGIV